MSRFDKDREEVLARAKAAGVEYIVTVGAEREDWPLVMEFADKNREKGIYSALGVHPHDASTFTDSSAKALVQAGEKSCVVAVGEIGLDYHYMNSSAAEQEEAFRRQIRIARDLHLPVIVHSRKADEETIKILKEENAAEVGGVLHCFSGSMKMAQEALGLGYFISFSGSLTFKNSDEQREIAKNLPIEVLLIETDCPYLSPQPKRGKRNEPAYVRFVAETLAEAKGLSTEDMGRITSHNAMQLFSLGTPVSEGKIAYQIRDSLYLNVTNQCTNECGFCIRNKGDTLYGHHLRLTREPSVHEVIASMGDPKAYREVVFCGYGESLIRLDLVKEVAAWIKKQGGRIRVNTNGQANLIHQRNVLPELKGLVDSYSVSLNAEDPETYLSICKPEFGKETYAAVKAFIVEAARNAEVNVTVVDLPDVDIEACRRIAEKELHVGFRLRYYDKMV